MTRDVKVVNVGGVPNDAQAVILNVTAVFPSATTHLTVFPDGTPMPTASNLNASPGQVVPNLVIVPVGINGQISIYNNSGSVNVIADVVGYTTAP